MMNSNLIITGIGAAFVLLAFCRFAGIVTLSEQYIISLSISAMFFTVGDLIEFLYSRKKTLTVYQNDAIEASTKYVTQINYLLSWEEYSVKFLPIVTLCGAIGSIFILPNINWEEYLTQQDLKLVSDFTQLLSLGIVIILIGYKNSAKYYDLMLSHLHLAAEYSRLNGRSQQTQETQTKTDNDNVS